ncbi:MAG: class I adenylate-forming enzyme family protein [Solirubrobacteraceae bacterium]
MELWLLAAARRYPHQAAVVTVERTLTYGKLEALSLVAAGALRDRGVRRGDRVALALPPGESFAVAVHGALLLGAVITPIDLRLSAEERALRAGAAVVVDEPLRGAAAAESAKVELDDPMAVLHTSGTTSTPKSVTLSYRNWLASAHGSAVSLGREEEDRWLCPMPLVHVGGLSVLIRSAIYGTTAILHERFDTEAVLAELMNPTRRITLVSLVPTMLARLLDAGLSHPPTLRWALLGGGPIAPALLERARDAGVPVAPTYGMTEACSQIATFGRPLPGTEVQLAPDGEILVRGDTVSVAALADDGWLHTGDLGRFDEERQLEIVGRKSDTIVTGGENVAPAEVEAVLLEHPDVADAAVHPRADPEWGEALVATIVLRDGAQPRPDELRGFCAGRVARFKVPNAFEFAAELPRTPGGKLLRRELR